MGMVLKIALQFLAAAFAVLIIFGILFFLRPVRVTVWLRRNALSRAGLRKTKISTSAGDQIVWQGGAGAILVLLHGAGDQAGTWYKVAAELTRHFQVVAPDLAGHGDSAPREGVLRLGTLLTALEQVLDSTPWQNAPLLMAGNSLGAWMTMLYTKKYPQRVRRAVLVDGGPIRGVSEIGLMPKSREEARRTMDAVLDPSSPHPSNFVLDDLIRVSNSGPISRLLAAGDEEISKYLLEDKLADFQTPVDIVWGASDRLVPLDYAKKLQSLLPRCTLTVIDRCGHAPQLERPGELTKVLLKILAADSIPAVHDISPPSKAHT